MDPRGKRGKRNPSKRVITARREMRSSHLLQEHDEGDHDWKKERKHNVHYSRSSGSKAHNYRLTKLKNRQVYKIQQDDYQG